MTWGVQILCGTLYRQLAYISFIIQRKGNCHDGPFIIKTQTKIWLSWYEWHKRNIEVSKVILGVAIVLHRKHF